MPASWFLGSFVFLGSSLSRSPSLKGSTSVVGAPLGMTTWCPSRRGIRLLAQFYLPALFASSSCVGTVTLAVSLSNDGGGNCPIEGPCVDCAILSGGRLSSMRKTIFGYVLACIPFSPLSVCGPVDQSERRV